MQYHLHRDPAAGRLLLERAGEPAAAAPLPRALDAAYDAVLEVAAPAAPPPTASLAALARSDAAPAPEPAAPATHLLLLGARGVFSVFEAQQGRVVASLALGPRAGPFRAAAGGDLLAVAADARAELRERLPGSYAVPLAASRGPVEAVGSGFGEISEESSAGSAGGAAEDAAKNSAKNSTRNPQKRDSTNNKQKSPTPNDSTPSTPRVVLHLLRVTALGRFEPLQRFLLARLPTHLQVGPAALALYERLGARRGRKKLFRLRVLRLAGARLAGARAFPHAKRCKSLALDGDAVLLVTKSRADRYFLSRYGADAAPLPRAASSQALLASPLERTLSAADSAETVEVVSASAFT